MTSEKPTPKATAQAPSFKEQWLNPRRLRFWAIILVLSYTLCGFFLVPLLVKNGIIDGIRDGLGREARIAEVKFNPYVLSLRISGFELDDSDGEQLARFDEFFANLQTSSLFRWAWTLREFSLDGARLNFERFAPGDSRLTRLMADADARAEDQENPEEESGGIPRFLIQELNIRNGGGQFLDHVPPSPVTLEAGPVDISIHDLNNLQDRHGQQSVAINLPDGGTLTWAGNISLGPLESEGKLSLENIKLERFSAYAEEMFPIKKLQASLSSRTNYKVMEQEDGSLEFELGNLEASLQALSATGLEPVTEFLTISSITVEGGSLNYPREELHLASVRLADAAMIAWLDENGAPSLLQLIPGEAVTRGAEQEPEPAANNWKVGIDEIVLEGIGASISDRSISPQAEVMIESLDIRLAGVNNDAGTIIPLELQGELAQGGNYGFEGKLTLLPGFLLDGTLSATGLPLALAQPYVEQAMNIRIEQGALDTRTEIRLHPDEAITATGELDISGLKILDTLENQDLLAWTRMNIDRFEADALARNASLSRIVIDELYGRVQIKEDRSTNFDTLAKEGSAEPPAPETTAEQPWDLTVGGIGIGNGSLDFSDLSLPLQFSTSVSKLDGTISTIATGSSEPANIRLEGQVDEFGLARIEGSMNVLDPLVHTDISVEFRNLLMSELSPYTVEFAGRKIDEGKLDLDLGYKIEKGQLLGANNIVLSDLLLGEEVDSPDAVSLPLGLAVALLKDSNGVIDIDLPVEGDINDPEFRIGGVVMKAVVSLITKVVTAPFRLLGSLIGVDSEDFGQFNFLAGRSDLTPPELEKVNQIRDALAQRPELRLEIAGTYNSEVDRPKLQFLSLRETVYQRLGASEDAAQDDTEMLDDSVRSVFEELFNERFPEIPANSLKAAHTAPPPDDPQGKPVFDQLAYAGDLRDRLLASEEITQADLEALAAERAAAIRDAFLADGGFDEARIVMTDSVAVESEDGEWIVAELGVATD